MEGGNEENHENQENPNPNPNQIQAPGAAPPAAPTTLTLAPEAISALVGKVGVKLPEFWPDSTALWFARADAQFRIKKITSEQTKFDHVISMLDSKTANQVLDILVTPPVLPYTALKQRLTKTRL